MYIICNVKHFKNYFIPGFKEAASIKLRGSQLSMGLKMFVTVTLPRITEKYKNIQKACSLPLLVTPRNDHYERKVFAMVRSNWQLHHQQRFFKGVVHGQAYRHLL